MKRDPIKIGIDCILMPVALCAALTLVAIGVIVLLSFAAPPSLAQDMQQYEIQVKKSELQTVIDCTADAQKYCSTFFFSGREAIINCMVANKLNLSPTCRRHIR